VSRKRPITQRAVRHHCLNATQTKRDELQTIAVRYVRVMDFIFQRYGGLEGLWFIDRHRCIRDAWVAMSFGDRFGLQGRYWKQALDDAFGVIKSLWGNAISLIEKKVARSKRFSREQKQYLYYLLLYPHQLYFIAKDDAFPIPVAFQSLPVKELMACHAWLHSQLRKCRGSKPQMQQARSFSIDPHMYDVRKDAKGRTWLAVMGMQPRKRIKLLLTDQAQLSGTLRVVLKEDRIEVHQAVKLDAPKPKPDGQCKVIRAADKGLKTMLDTSAGERFGEGFGELLEAESDRLTEKNRKRNKLRAVAHKHWENGEVEKALNIEVYNLGALKYEVQKAEARRRIEAFLNQALNEFFTQVRPDLLITEKLNFYSWKQLLPRRTKRLFASWLKGLLRERIEFKAAEHGVLHAEVNAAYSSRECPFCHWVEPNNRHGDVFHCHKCGREGNAHHFAALNLMNRYYDPEIDVYTSAKEVRTILLRRYQTAETVQPGL
jgi:putative transposase